MIKISVGDPEFQKTLSECEWKYIHEGQNWISKGGRETSLKALHEYGYTLDQINELPEDDRKRIWKEALDSWNNSFKKK